MLQSSRFCPCATTFICYQFVLLPAIWLVIGSKLMLFVLHLVFSGRRSAWGGWRGSAERWGRDPSRLMEMDGGGDGVLACFFGCSTQMRHLAGMSLPPFFCWMAYVGNLLFSRPAIVAQVIQSFASRQISHHVYLYGSLLLAANMYLY
jgi:hypothetical protein